MPIIPELKTERSKVQGQASLLTKPISKCTGQDSRHHHACLVSILEDPNAALKSHLINLPILSIYFFLLPFLKRFCSFVSLFIYLLTVGGGRVGCMCVVLCDKCMVCVCRSKEECQESYSILSTSFPWDWELIRVSSQQAPGILLSPHPQHRGKKHPHKCGIQRLTEGPEL